MPKLAAVPDTLGPQATRHIDKSIPREQTTISVIRCPTISTKIPIKGTKKNPRYCVMEEYHPALIAEILKRCSANSVLLEEKTLAVDVWKRENKQTSQKDQGSVSIFLISNFLLFSVSFSPVAGSLVPAYRFSHQRVNHQKNSVATLVNRFMNTAIQYAQLKSPRFSEMTFAVALPTKEPIFPMPSSKASVEAKPDDGGNHEEKILYWATWVATSPRAWIMTPPIMNL
ncbi:hypothetical protein HG530_008549 [Fusarium avenaceum]|nr:hypothetical protein HG530_008549 [Fusarium avenaceum]